MWCTCPNSPGKSTVRARDMMDPKLSVLHGQSAMSLARDEGGSYVQGAVTFIMCHVR